MSNYQQTTFFTPKDTLPTTSPLKTIFGAAYDVEFGNIATAVNSKLDQSSGTTNLTLPLGSASAPSLNFLGATTTGLYATTTPSLGIAIGGTSVGTIVASSFALTIGQTITPASINGFSGALTLANVNTGTGAGVLLQLNAGTTPSTLQILQTQSGYTGTPVTNGLTGGIQSVISGPGQMSLGCGNGAFMNVSAAGNISTVIPSSGVALTVNGIAGQNTILASVPPNGTATIQSFSSGGTGAAYNTATVSGSVAIAMLANNTGSTLSGVATASAGLTTTTASPMVFAVNSAARMTLGSATGAATSFQLAGMLLSTSATAGSNGATPSQVAGYLNLQLNGSSYKMAYYNP